jgi:hypothetical protein
MNYIIKLLPIALLFIAFVVQPAEDIEEWLMKLVAELE